MAARKPAARRSSSMRATMRRPSPRRRWLARDQHVLHLDDLRRERPAVEERDELRRPPRRRCSARSPRLAAIASSSAGRWFSRPDQVGDRRRRPRGGRDAARTSAAGRGRLMGRARPWPQRRPRGGGGRRGRARGRVRETPERARGGRAAIVARVPLAASQPIGVFDSGVGGLTILDECLAALPAEDFVYFGDTGFFPYGDRDADAVRAALARDRPLARRSGVKLIVVACNTATAVALADLQRGLDVAGDRRHRAGGARGRPGDPQPPRRPDGHRGHRALGLLPADGPRPRRRGPDHQRRLPGPRAGHPAAATRWTRRSPRWCAATPRRSPRPAWTP